MFDVTSSGQQPQQPLVDVVRQVRLEVAQSIRAIAATESDPRVVARLFEVAARVAQELAGAEATERLKIAPVVPYRFDQPSKTRLDVIATGVKTTTTEPLPR